MSRTGPVDDIKPRPSQPSQPLMSPPPAADEADPLPRWIALGLFVAVFALYGGSLGGDFVRLDDYQYVVDNTYVRNPSRAGVAVFFSQVMHPTTVDGYYQPLTMISLMLDTLIVGRPDAGAGIYRFTNVLLHAINAVLVFALLRRVLRLHRAAGGSIDAPEPLFAPAIAAALFAFHPAQVESVCWISQRKTVLATMLALAALLAYLRHAESGRRGAAWGALWWYLLATGAKPTVILLPLALPLLDRWPLRRPIASRLASKWPFAIVMAGMGYVAWHSQASVPEALAAPNLAGGAMIARWVGLLSYNFVLYLGNLVWPMHLSPYRAIPADLSLVSPAIAASVALSAAVLVAWVASWRRSAPLFVGLTAFIVLLSPALGGIRFTGTCVADRFVYLPMIFLLMPLTALLWHGDAFMRRRALAYRGAAALVLAPFVILCWAQQRVWADTKALFTHVVAATPDKVKFVIHLASIAVDEDDAATALDYAQRAARLAPDDGEAAGVLGQALIVSGRVDEGVASLERALALGLGPNQASGWVALARARTRTGDATAVRAACQRAIDLGRPPSEAYAEAGDAAMREAGQIDLAIEMYRAAVAADEGNAIAQWNLGTALVAAGRLPEALTCYETAVALRRRAGLPTAELDAPLAALRARMASPPATNASTTTPATRPPMPPSTAGQAGTDTP